MNSITKAQARRIALGAQGFSAPRPNGTSGRRQVHKVLQHTQLLQIDSVNVLARAHEMPLWSRLGSYRRGVLDEMVNDSELFEYWAHEASLLPVGDWPLMQFRMDAAKNGSGWTSVVTMQERNPTIVAEVLAVVRDQGPTVASSFNQPGRRTGPWWDWSDAKLALEYLFWTGQLTARRRSNFERAYDLPERALPSEIVNATAIPEAEARRILLERSGRALGVATDRDLFDYYRLKARPSRAALDGLIEDGVLIPVQVEGWNKPAFLHRDANLPRRINAASLLSPFDPVVWDRQRCERLFDFHYRIEIYTPKPKRVYGYYVLPFLMNDAIAARVDLKANRQSQVLEVPGAFSEGHSPTPDVAAALTVELLALAQWLQLDSIEVGTHGDLTKPLRAELRRN